MSVLTYRLHLHGKEYGSYLPQIHIHATYKPKGKRLSSYQLYREVLRGSWLTLGHMPIPEPMEMTEEENSNWSARIMWPALRWGGGHPPWLTFGVVFFFKTWVRQWARPSKIKDFAWPISVLDSGGTLEVNKNQAVRKSHWLNDCQSEQIGKW